MNEPPQIGTRIRIIAEGVVTAYDPGSDAVQLDYEECWWPYSDAGTSVHYEEVADAPLRGRRGWHWRRGA